MHDCRCKVVYYLYVMVLWYLLWPEVFQSILSNLYKVDKITHYVARVSMSTLPIANNYYSYPQYYL